MMKTQQTMKNKPVIILMLTLVLILTLVYWIWGASTDVYVTAFSGALFESLWLPMVLMTAALPFVSLYFWNRNGRGYRSLFLYIFVLSVLSIYFLIRMINNDSL